MGWLPLVGSLKLWVSFAEDFLFYRALLQKGPMILRSLLIEATPCIHQSWVLEWYKRCSEVCCSVLQCVAVCCSVLQCVAVCRSVPQCVAMCCSAMRCVAVCCSVLQHCVLGAMSLLCETVYSCTKSLLYAKEPCTYLIMMNRFTSIYTNNKNRDFWHKERHVADVNNFFFLKYIAFNHCI